MGRAVLLLLLFVAAAARTKIQIPAGPDRGRYEATGEPLAAGPFVLHGVLLDGGCADRSNLSVLQPAETTSVEPEGGVHEADRMAMPQSSGVAAHGVSVDSATVNRERADILPHLVADLRSRQRDFSCAITGETRGFALLLDSGRLLVLDDGGGVQAVEMIQTTDEGRAMMNGAGPGVKPRVKAAGLVRGDRLIVETLQQQ
jgi:hypothetical protein